jgi:hypothetical protein
VPDAADEASITAGQDASDNIRIMHRRAEKLADRFNQASVLRMAKGNERGAPTEALFHYTSVAALTAIIASETFWFASVYHMDDD